MSKFVTYRNKYPLPANKFSKSSGLVFCNNYFIVKAFYNNYKDKMSYIILLFIYTGKIVVIIVIIEYKL